MSDAIDHEMRRLLDHRLNWRFRAGENDCGLLVLHALLVRTGRQDLRDLCDAIEGQYETEAQGVRLALRHCGIRKPGEPFETLCCHFFGDPVAPLQARKWDPVVGDFGNGPTLGLHEGRRLVAVSDDMLTRLPLSRADLAWRVD